MHLCTSFIWSSFSDAFSIAAIASTPVFCVNSTSFARFSNCKQIVSVVPVTLHLIDKVQDRLAGATIISKLDLQCGLLADTSGPKGSREDSILTWAWNGLFQFTRMPFGLCGAPSTFQRLMDLVIEAGLALRGSKCEIGMNQVAYLGHTFAREGMAPDGSKVDAVVVVNWPQPRDEAEVGRFLGLASYYCKYIDKFADIAAPPTPADSERCSLQWTQECEESFKRLKACLTKAPCSVKPVVWHRSQHYGVTDRCQPIGLQHRRWRASCVAALLPIQEFSFEIVYRKGIANGNRIAMSRREPEIETPHAAMTTVYAGFTPEELKKVQKQDDAIQQLYTALNSQQNPTQKLEATTNETICPVYEALHQKAMSLCHDSPTAGHQGNTEDMGKNTAGGILVRSTLTNIPIGRPWQMIAIDILDVPVSTKNNRYLLVIQDYFTKWADARPLKDQTAVRIKAELGDGMVERFNRSLLQLLRTYVERQEDWEQHLPLALHPQPNTITPARGYEATSYQAVLQAKMAELQDLVEAHVAESAHRQKVNYDILKKAFKAGDRVWLSVPTAGKLDP
eukprot:Em0013g206a